MAISTTVRVDTSGTLKLGESDFTTGTAISQLNIAKTWTDTQPVTAQRNVTQEVENADRR